MTAIAAEWLGRGRSALSRAADAVDAWRVPYVLGALVVVEWLAVLGTARAIRHAAWIYYQGGDQLWYYTLGWLLGHGQLTQTQVGYGTPFLYAPIARIAGPDLLSALPAIVLLNVLVLLPAAMLALYGIAARIGGRLFGYWALVLWIVVPFVGIRYTNAGYHERYTELTLPQSLGLTAMADMPTMVATLVACYFCMKTLADERPQLIDGIAAGVAAGAAIAIKPSTALFLAGPLLAFAYRRRMIPAAAMVAGLAPALVTLTVWKARGLGSVPLFQHAAPHIFGGGLAASAPIAALGLGRYFNDLSWSQFETNLDLIREHFWSVRLIEWIVFAGLIGLARRSRTAALFVGGWFFAFAIVKGAYPHASIEDGSLFRVMMPSFPAFVLLIAGLPLLWPRLPGRLREWRVGIGEPRERTRWALVGLALLVSAVLPLAAIAASSTSGSLDPASAQGTIMPVPANVELGLAATVSGRRVTLTWRDGKPLGGPVFYRIWRARADGFTCPQQAGARLCNVTMPEVGATHATTFVDRTARGRWIYRVAIAANWLNDTAYGDPYLISRPLAVTVP